MCVVSESNAKRFVRQCDVEVYIPISKRSRTDERKKGENAKRREKIHSEREIRWMKSLDKINEKGFKTRNLL